MATLTQLERWLLERNGRELIVKSQKDSNHCPYLVGILREGGKDVGLGLDESRLILDIMSSVRLIEGEFVKDDEQNG